MTNDPVTGEIRPYTEIEIKYLKSLEEMAKDVEERDKHAGLPLGVHNVLSPHEIDCLSAYQEEKRRQQRAMENQMNVPSFLDPKEGWNASQVARAEILRDSDYPVERRLSMVAEELQRGGLVSPPMAVYTVVIDARAVVLELREKVARQRWQAGVQWVALAILAGLIFFY